MRKFIKSKGYAIFLGVFLVWLGFSGTDWRILVVLLPMCLLVEWKAS